MFPWKSQGRDSVEHRQSEQTLHIGWTMPRRIHSPLWLLILLALAGCAISRRYGSLELPPAARLVELGQPAEVAPRVQQSEIRMVSGTSAREPSNVLVLSGGGSNGAYTAGVLNGWTEAGNRPRFDVVTGISTGALIAPFAFLGSEFDDLLKRNYTESRDRDIFIRRWLPALIYADSLADSAPLRKQIGRAHV